ncbi:relaxation protein [Lysobacter sp. TAB13]|uniref:relaxation protein n=1 Tax=Lysobacter sp. TAB13 TaxID=3233065 RepID=UPI003F96973C
MNEEAATILVSKIAALVEQFDRRCEQTDRELRQLTQQVPGMVRQSADEQMRRIPGEVMGSVRDGIEQPVAAYEQRLHEAGGLLQSGSQALAMQLQRMERLHKQLVWKVAGITLGSLVLLLSGGAWLSKHYYDEIRRNQISADLLKAYNQADVTLCGGRLCAKLENGGKQRSEYVLVKSR